MKNLEETQVVDLVPITERVNAASESVEQVVSARAVHKSLEATETFTAWWKRCLPFITGLNPKNSGAELFIPCKLKVVQSNNGSIMEVDDYLIPIDEAKILCMVSKTKKADIIRRYFIEVEKAWNDSDKILERGFKILQYRVEKRTRLLRQAGGLVLELRQENTGLKVENKELKEKMQGLEEENQDLKEENEELKEKAGDLDTYFTIKRMEIKTGKKYNCWPLINYSKSNGYEIKKVEDSYFNEVNAYHVDVWKQVYQLNCNSKIAYIPAGI